MEHVNLSQVRILIRLLSYCRTVQCTHIIFDHTRHYYPGLAGCKVIGGLEMLNSNQL